MPSLFLSFSNSPRLTKPGLYKIHQGSVLVEFFIGGVMLVLVLLGVLQMLLLYRGYIHLQQATFAAARYSIVNNGTLASLQHGFIDNSLDIHGGGQTSSALLAAYGRAQFAVRTPLLLGGAGVTIERLNPSALAFTDWSIRQGDQQIIPNTWQTRVTPTAGPQSNMTIVDANILKVRITYGYPLHIPIIDRVIGRAMTFIDPGNSLYYQASPVRLPLTTTAVMHMQSDVYQ